MNSNQAKRSSLGPNSDSGIPVSCGVVLPACLAFLLVIMPVTPVLAQCGEGNGKGADIRTCADEMIEAQGRTIELLGQMTQQMAAMGLLQGDQMDAATSEIEFLKRRHSRAREEKDDATDDEFDALVVKGTPSVCTFRLRPAFIEGPPGKPSERPLCDDDQIAENKCQEICEFSDTEKARNAGKGQRTEDDLADAIQQTKMVNEMIEDEVASLAFQASTLTLSSDDPCAFVNPHPVLRNSAFFPQFTLAVNQATTAMDTIQSLAQDSCRQSLFGHNASLGCVVFTTLWAIAQQTSNFVNTVNGNFTSATVDATFNCAKALKTNSDKQGQQLENLENEVADVKNMLNEVKTLLSTPQGRREGFPTN